MHVAGKILRQLICPLVQSNNWFHIFASIYAYMYKQQVAHFQFEYLKSIQLKLCFGNIKHSKWD